VVAKTSTKTVSFTDGKVLFFFNANLYCHLIRFLFLFSAPELPRQIHFGLHLQEKYFCFYKLSLSKIVSDLKSFVSLVLCWLYGMLGFLFERQLSVLFHFFLSFRAVFVWIT